jgi:hypothetical protein
MFPVKVRFDPSLLKIRRITVVEVDVTPEAAREEQPSDVPKSKG